MSYSERYRYKIFYKKEVLHTVSNADIYFSSDNVHTVNVV
jgi:hypothetical protein